MFLQIFQKKIVSSETIRFVTIMLLCFSCAGKKNAPKNSEDQDGVVNSAIVDTINLNPSREVVKDSSTDWSQVIDFDQFFVKKWSITLDEDPGKNDYLISGGLLLTPFLIEGNNALDIVTGNLINIARDSVFVKDSARTDSLYLVKTHNYSWIYDIKNNRKIFETYVRNFLRFEPIAIDDSIFVLKNSGRSIAAMHIGEKPTLIWKQDFSSESPVYGIYQKDSLTIVEAKRGIFAFDKYSGDKLWAIRRIDDDHELYFEADWIREERMLLIDEKNYRLLEIALHSGDTLHTFNGTYEFEDHLLDGDHFYFSNEQGVFSFDVQHWEIAWELRDEKPGYYDIETDDTALYTFVESRFIKVNKRTGKIVWKTLDDAYGSPIIIADTYILTNMATQEGGTPVIVEKETGYLIAEHYANLHNDENFEMYKSINIYMHNIINIPVDKLLVENFESSMTTVERPKTTYLLLERK